MTNSKKKGNSFEREVANLLSDLYGKKFYRNKDSGSFTGGSNSKNITNQYMYKVIGDIIVPDGFQMIIECKNYSAKSFQFHSLFRENKMLEKWIDQLVSPLQENKDLENYLFLLFFKISNKGTYVVEKIKNNQIELNIEKMSNSHLYKYKDDYYVIMSLEKFKNIMEK